MRLLLNTNLAIFFRINNSAVWLLIVWLPVVLAGCAQVSETQEFFEKKPTEIESKMILRDISRVHENPNLYNPLPEMYRTPPQRLAMEDGVRMFYFTRNHPAQQIANDLKRLGYKVSQNPSTNQVIIQAADNAECDVIEEYLLRTDVPPIQVHIDCIILERFADVTKDWETSILIENLFGEQITLGESRGTFDSEGRLTRLEPAFPGASLRESKRGEFGMDFGFWKNEGVSGHQVRAIVDVLESRGYLKILLNPTLETVTGKAATVQIRDRRPVPIRVTEKDKEPYTLTQYEWVSDTLTVTPYAYADGSIGLKTSINIGSASKPEGVIQTSIITQRSIDVAENRVRPGSSLIIGGMRRSENRSVIRGTPFFKDLPLIGPLFSSKDYEENATEIVFILTPTISSGSVPYSETAQMIREKYRTPDYNDILESLVSDPLASDVYVQYLEDKADEAQTEAIRFERKAKRAEFEAEQNRLRAEQTQLEMQLIEAQIEQARREYEQAVAQAKAAQAQAEAAAKERQLQEVLISQTEEEIQNAVKTADEARVAAEKAQAELQQAQKKTEAAREETEKLKARQEVIKAEIESLQQQTQQPPMDTETPIDTETQTEQQ